MVCSVFDEIERKEQLKKQIGKLTKIKMTREK
jgi:hypothetical protein